MFLFARPAVTARVRVRAVSGTNSWRAPSVVLFNFLRVSGANAVVRCTLCSAENSFIEL